MSGWRNALTAAGDLFTVEVVHDSRAMHADLLGQLIHRGPRVVLLDEVVYLGGRQPTLSLARPRSAPPRWLVLNLLHTRHQRRQGVGKLSRKAH